MSILLWYLGFKTFVISDLPMHTVSVSSTVLVASRAMHISDREVVRGVRVWSFVGRLSSHVINPPKRVGQLSPTKQPDFTSLLSRRTIP